MIYYSAKFDLFKIVHEYAVEYSRDHGNANKLLSDWENMVQDWALIGEF